MIYRIVVRRSGHAVLDQRDRAGQWVPRAHVLPEVWAAIGPVIQSEIVGNRQRAGLKRGRWTSPIPLEVQEGKEALLLFWGAERAELRVQLDAVIANWKQLPPEVRWWLVTSADATRGMPSYSPTRGWRQAIYHILTEAHL